MEVGRLIETVEMWLSRPRRLPGGDVDCLLGVLDGEGSSFTEGSKSRPPSFS